jgi:hypothetical protein
MKTLLRNVGALVVIAVVLLVVFRITGLNPHDRTPGLWLNGNVVTTPVTDWSFTDQVPTIKVQTQSWYGLPHSVTTNCLSYNGQLYLTSVYPAGTTRAWDENVKRNPHVRVKIAGNLYDGNAVMVTDPAEREAVLQARLKKYPKLKTPENSTVNIFHIVG